MQRPGPAAACRRTASRPTARVRWRKPGRGPRYCCIGHFVFGKPEERKFVTAELIRRTTFTATEQALQQRVEALREAGWSQLVVAITPGEERAIEDWARIKRAFD